MDDKKARFSKLYSNLPIPVREEIIVVIEGEPYTWNVANIEILNDTDIGDKILVQLDKLGII